MGEKDRRIDVFMQKATAWRAEMEALRAVVLTCDVTETLKWRQPCYTAHGGNVCIIGAFKDHARLMFFRGSLLADPEGVLVSGGENSQAGRYLAFRSVAEVDEAAAIITRLVAEAADLVAQGRKVDFKARNALELPDALTQALAADAPYREAWAKLTPGRQRSWCLHLEGAKKSETRERRVVQARVKVIEGKGWNER